MNFLACVDNPGWSNFQGHGCESYKNNGWCKNGGFSTGSEWIGSAQVDKRVGNGCASGWKSGYKSCADVYNHPERNCCVCGKDTNPNIYYNNISGLYMLFRVSVENVSFLCFRLF